MFAADATSTYSISLSIRFKEILVEQWERIGKTVAIPVIEVLASDLEWNYRASLQFRLDDQGGLGFSRMNEVGVIPIREYYLPSEPVAQTWPLCLNLSKERS